jgi:phosphate transport system substrate-binding protein
MSVCRAAALLLLPILCGSLVACAPAADPELVRVDGSSTVYPIVEAAAEDFLATRRGQARITVGVSGSGGGFKKFCRGDIDLADASRPITPEEAADCAAHGIEFIELPIAFDAVTVVVNPANDWVESLDVQTLSKIWSPQAQGRVQRWSDVDRDWPDRPLNLFGAGADSGTFDYFTRVINGRARASRGDYTASESDHLLVAGVASDAGALAFFGYAYYRRNAERLRAVPIREHAGAPAVLPSAESIRSGAYRPLSRPLFVYVNAARLQASPLLREFTEVLMTGAGGWAEEVGFVALPEAGYAAARRRLENRTSGSVFGEGGMLADFAALARTESGTRR